MDDGDERDDYGDEPIRSIPLTVEGNPWTTLLLPFDRSRQIIIKFQAIYVIDNWRSALTVSAPNRIQPEYNNWSHVVKVHILK